MKKKKENKKLMSMKEYAKSRGVSYEIIRRHCKEKKLTRIGKLIDPEAADKELENNLAINGNAKLVNKTKPAILEEVNHTAEYNKARARKEKSKADLAELEYKERSGLLISINVVEKEAEDLYRAFRDRMLNVVIRSSKKLLGEADEFRFRKILKHEIEEAIKEIK